MRRVLGGPPTSDSNLGFLEVPTWASSSTRALSIIGRGIRVGDIDF
jgi:hypothetical protein